MGNGGPPQETAADARGETNDPLLPALLGAQGLISTARTNNPLIVRKEQLATYNLMVDTYSSAVDRVKKATKINTSAGTPQAESNETSLILHRGLGGLSISQEDPLEAFRVAQGLDKVREELFAELKDTVDPEGGINELFSFCLKLDKICTNIGELNALFPHLTLTEISFLPLLQELPTYFTSYGTTYDPHKIAPEAGILDDAQKRVPAQFIGRPHGMTYVLDTYFPDSDNEGVRSNDPYQILGMTDGSDQVETVLFQEGIAKMIYQLIPLIISNNDLYKRIWKEASEALQLGIGRIAQLAYERTTGTINPENLQDAIAWLPKEQRVAFLTERSLLERLVVQATLKDEAHDVILRAQDVVKLVGILDQVPQCLTTQPAFKGFVQPNGATVRFFNTEGQLVEECVLSPVHARALMQSMDAEYNDSSRENSTVMHIFDELTIAAQTKIMEGAQPLSRIENVGMQAWQEHSVALQVLPSPVLRTVRSWGEMYRHVITAKDEILESTTKIGADEAELYQRVLNILPPSFWKDVDVLRKVRETRSLADFHHNMLTSGTYRPDTLTVSVHETSEYLFPDLPDIAQADRIFTILHECGESLWATMEQSLKARWSAISWKKRLKTKKPKAVIHSEERQREHFLTRYSRSAPNEDFAEHFAAYVCTGPNFRNRSLLSLPLQKKYELLQSIVAERAEKDSLEFQQILPWSLEEMQAGWNYEREQKDLEHAIQDRQAALDALDAQAQEEIDTVRASFDQMTEVEVHREAIEEADIEDPSERQFLESMPPENASQPLTREWKAERQRIVAIQAEDCLTALMPEENTERQEISVNIARILIARPWKNARHAIAKILAVFGSKEEVFEVLATLHDIDVSSGMAKLDIQGIVDMVKQTKSEDEEGGRDKGV